MPFESNEKDITVLPIGYLDYGLPIISEEIDFNKIMNELTHSSKFFWSGISPGEYDPYVGQLLLDAYNLLIEYEMQLILNKEPLLYWYHVYRWFPNQSIGIDKQPVTIGLTKAILNAAIQKYCSFLKSSHLRVSNEIAFEKILDGRLSKDPRLMDFLKEEFLKEPQIVLIDFNSNNLCNFIELEKLAYECWRSTAVKRILGKGTYLCVSNNHYYYDNRSNELDFLVSFFDMRIGNQYKFNVSSTGMVFSHKESREGLCLLPLLNVDNQPFNDAVESILKIKIPYEYIPRYIFAPFNLKQFYQSHKPFEIGFLNTYGVSYLSVICLLGSLLYRVLFLILDGEIAYVLNLLNKGYEGPINKDLIIEDLIKMQPILLKELGIEIDNPSEIDFYSAFDFWTLIRKRQSKIDLAHPGPHSLFIQYPDDRIIIDYAWISRRLYDLFINVTVEDQNFKGKALEEFIKEKPLILTTKELTSLAGEHKQIDASFRYKEILIIIECKAKARSIAFDRGEISAIQMRIDFINKCLGTVDEKALWLSRNPKGTNYDITEYSQIVPIAVTPFVEYIPSIDPKYWLYAMIPRVLSPQELLEILDESFWPFIENNIFKIHCSDD